MKCDKCGQKMLKVDRREEMADLDEDATEGQTADYYAAELSGDMGNWRLGIVEYMCPKCNAILDLVSDYLEDYRPLIIEWHNKADIENDYFSKCVFEYLSFTAYIKIYVALDANTDRAAIQILKRNKILKKLYLDEINKIDNLKSVWVDLIKQLKREPLCNSSKDLDYPELDNWWNCSKENPCIDKEPVVKKGVIHSLSDWENMVEFWYGVRNNLFHGSNNPNIKRDQFLVEYAFKTQKAFMDMVVKVFIKT